MDFVTTADDRICKKCQKSFTRPCYLQRHLKNKKPCSGPNEDAESVLKCRHCGASFTTKSAKSRHENHICKRREAFSGKQIRTELACLQNQIDTLAQTISNTAKTEKHEGAPQKILATNVIVNNGPVIQTTNNGNVDNSHKVMNNVINDSSKNLTVNSHQSANYLPGWPTKWTPPLVEPKPFTSPSYIMQSTELRQAMARLGAADAEACSDGDPRGVSALLVEILRQIHEDPQERNIYLSPDRGDQAMVFVPRQWSLKPLREATQYIFNHMVKELADVPMHGFPRETKIAAGARDGFGKKPTAVVQTSNNAITAHLKNMEALLGQPGQQAQMLEGASWTAGAESPRMFGGEAFGHMELASTIYSMELSVGVNCEQDVVEARYPELASRAVYSLAKQVLQWKAKNQTAVQATKDTALIRTHRGWEERPAGEVSEKMFRHFAGVVADFVEGEVRTPLRPLGGYIRANINALAAEERKTSGLLAHYSWQADRVCATSTNPEFVKLGELLRAAKEKHAPQADRASPLLAAEEAGSRRTEPFDILDSLGWNG